ncbi:MAG: LD-carboxypeptidase [Clostridiales bacterium]|jgi:muramoyltetrapeptide carboxypeptidase LdcA involved in peptidoglycan recycling|nr:LD-carboxypeptidase [Clostridiales bacterium]
MKPLVKPPSLKPGDTVATVSLSGGYAGDSAITWRYMQGKEQLENLFGLKVVEMPHTLSNPEYVYNHPEARAQDMMEAFADPEIKGIFTVVGGNDTIRLLPFIDYSVIRNNPKAFIGYSDTTVNHFMCYKAGISSFYGPSILSDLAENLGVPEYTAKWIKKALFASSPIGEIKQSPTWTSEHLSWVIENKNTARTFSPNNGHETLQGGGIAKGRLIGGCIEVFDWLRGTELFPPIEDFDGAIMFFETSEEMLPPSNFEYILRALGVMGVLERLNGMVFSKPCNNRHYDEYKAKISKVLAEYGRSSMPVLCNLSFGHCEPKFIIPYGAIGEIDCERKAFAILEG